MNQISENPKGSVEIVVCSGMEFLDRMKLIDVDTGFAGKKETVSIHFDRKVPVGFKVYSECVRI
jgi:hypothetical protein